MAHSSKVFISYSHDSDAHREFVLRLSDDLRKKDGLKCWIDRYHNGAPAEGWQRWMEQQIESADFVLLVCTPLYLKRFKGEDNEGGRGATFEGLIISQSLYDDYYKNTKFIPVIPAKGSIDHVPLALKGGNTYQLPNQYDELCRVLTNQPATPAPVVGKTRTLAMNTDRTNISATDPTNNQYTLWLSFLVEQKNDQIQAECRETEMEQISSLPREKLLSAQSGNPQPLQAMFELLLGDQQQALNFLQQFPETVQLERLEDTKIRLRIMTDDPELAILPWQNMQFPASEKTVLEAGWIIEIGSPQHRYKPGFTRLNIHKPLIVIPVDQENETSSGQHYALIHDYLNSYLGIAGFIPQVKTKEQLKHELQHEQPDFIYFYCRIENDQLQLDDQPLALQALAEMLEQAKLQQPCVFLNLIGTAAVDIFYPVSLVKATRLVWLQMMRSYVQAHPVYEQSLLKVLTQLRHTDDLVGLITKENIAQQHTAYVWLNYRSPSLKSEDDALHLGQQLRAAMLRVMLGRKELKGSMNTEISNIAHRDQRHVLVYAISGDAKACPFELPEQIRQTLQFEDRSRSLPVISFKFYLTIDPNQDSYHDIEDKLSKGLLQGSPDIKTIFEKEQHRRGLVAQDCCIMLSWLLTVPTNNIDKLDEVIRDWIQDTANRF